jgi:hypothetical protein
MQRLKCALEARRPCEGRPKELVLRSYFRRVRIEGSTACGDVVLRIILRHAQAEVNAHIGMTAATLLRDLLLVDVVSVLVFEHEDSIVPGHRGDGRDLRGVRYWGVLRGRIEEQLL